MNLHPPQSRENLSTAHAPPDLEPEKKERDTDVNYMINKYNSMQYFLALLHYIGDIVSQSQLDLHLHLLIQSILVFSKDALHLSKSDSEELTMLQNTFILNECYSFKLSIQQRILIKCITNSTQNN